MTTIKDVAEKANVSIATVSRAINNKGYVSKKTRDIIDKAIQELNYSPNQLARNLYASETKVIGYIVPSICHPFFSEITQIIEKKLHNAGFHMLLCTTDRNADREVEIIDILRQHRVDGIIVGSYTPNIEAYSKAGIPVVAFDTLLECANVCVSSNHHIGGEMVADRVLKSNCRSVLQVIGNPDAKTDATSRHRVFFERMTQAGIPCISVPITDHSDLDIFTYSKLAEDLIRTYPGVDTYFATDLIAIEIVKAAVHLGYRVPDDIQVIGYDGSYIASMSCPTVTTVCQPIPDLAHNVVTSMCQLINGESVRKSVVLNNLFIQEGTTMR